MQDERLELAIDFLHTLVGFDSVSRNSNLSIVGYIEDYLDEHYVECIQIPSPDGKKANLLARIGPEVAGGVVLSGHTDVVPIDGQDWDTDPFNLTRTVDRLYGRGSCDMKGFIACVLAMVPEYTELELTKPIYLAFSYDEEVGCLGVPHLLDHLVKHMPKPSFAVIGEPTMMQMVTAHKGVFSFETTVHGFECHSSQTHLGVNAVQYAAELVVFLKQLALELMTTTHNPHFSPPYATVHVGVIRGGTARNIMPKECVFNWEIRPLPDMDTEKILNRFTEKCSVLEAEMKRIKPESGIATKQISRMPGVQLPEHDHIPRRMVMHCAQTNHEIAVSFGTEAGVFQQHGIPAIVCGPGDIAQAHKPNEYVEIAQLEACLSFLQRVGLELTTASE